MNEEDLECVHALSLHTLHLSERESVRKTDIERERWRKSPELLFLFLKGMTGAWAPFSYLV